MDNDLVHSVADTIRNVYDTRMTIPPVAGSLPADDIDVAYAVQQVNTRHWLSRGRRVAGYKIGLTSQAVQRQLGVSQPDFGVLFADMAACDSQDICAESLLQPRVEAEVAFVMAKQLNRERLTVADVVSATAYALPVIEIVDSRITDWKISIVDTIADNASSGMFVLGNEPRLLRNLELRTAGMTMVCNNQPVSTGVGASCLGHPINATLWLAETLVRMGTCINEGDIVLSGALGPMIPAASGKVYEAKINGLGSVRAAFEYEEKP